MIFKNLKNKPVLIFICVIAMCDTLHAQTDTAITYTHLNIVDSISKQAIYEKVKLWSVNAFKNVSGALQLDDKESGILAYDASTEQLSPNAPKTDVVWKLVPWYYKYTFKFKIQIKDGKYKIDVTDIKFADAGGEYHILTSTTTAPYKYMFSKQSKTDQEWQDAKLTFSDFSTKLIASLDAEVTKKEDW